MPFGKERVLDLDHARDLGKAGNLVDQLALGHAPHGEGEFGAEREAVKHR
jgi:hypothetical protein